ncbi:MAG: hypothetical protein M0C28_46045 [Candidatus Moduliflexus flocculans]|nr:hypothetical protein [Candidatus Moduliflexus flocculans]
MKPGRTDGDRGRNGTLRAVVDGESGDRPQPRLDGARDGPRARRRFQAPGARALSLRSGRRSREGRDPLQRRHRSFVRGARADLDHHPDGRPGGRGRLVREYRFVEGVDRLDIAVTLDKEKVREKESVHIGFPFAVPGGTVRVDLGWASVTPRSRSDRGGLPRFLLRPRQRRRLERGIRRDLDLPRRAPRRDRVPYRRDPAARANGGSGSAGSSPRRRSTPTP